MPTSKDILNDAEKSIKKNDISKKVLDDIVKISTKDVAEFAKARGILASSMNSMNGSVKTLESQVKNLNASLSALKKNEAVMQAPADSKKFKILMKSYADMIKEGMTYYKDIKGLMKKGQQLSKG